MSLNFRKHNPKSFVVRGDIIENISSRQRLISKLSGKCVYNTKLKFGCGLLVPINDKNEQVLNDYPKEENPKEILEHFLTLPLWYYHNKKCQKVKKSN